MAYAFDPAPISGAVVLTVAPSGSYKPLNMARLGLARPEVGLQATNAAVCQALSLLSSSTGPPPTEHINLST